MQNVKDAYLKSFDILSDEVLITIGVKKDKMNECSSYNIQCPFALSANAPVPCIGSQDNCDQWRNRYEECYGDEKSVSKPKKPEKKSRLEVLGIQDKEEQGSVW